LTGGNGTTDGGNQCGKQAKDSTISSFHIQHLK
jgi:hypothetical protein